MPSEENNKVFGRAQSFVAGPAPEWYLQFIVKDSRKFAATAGWGFAQFDRDGKPADEAKIKTCFPLSSATPSSRLCLHSLRAVGTREKGFLRVTWEPGSHITLIILERAWSESASPECGVVQVARLYLTDTKVSANTIVQWTPLFKSGLIAIAGRAWPVHGDSRGCLRQRFVPLSVHCANQSLKRRFVK